MSHSFTIKNFRCDALLFLCQFFLWLYFLFSIVSLDLGWLDTVFLKKKEIHDLDPYFWKIITCLKIKNTFVM